MRVTEGGSYEELVDPCLGNDYNPQEMLRMVACAAACIRHSARRRPKMSQVSIEIVLVIEYISYFQQKLVINSTLFGNLQPICRLYSKLSSKINEIHDRNEF